MKSNPTCVNRGFTIPRPAGPSRALEFLTLNAGEGAFHWVRCHHQAGCSGWIFDCGTTSGAKKIQSSINDMLLTLKEAPPPALLIVSHYHNDHISHIKKLRSVFAGRQGQWGNSREKVWIPAIEPYSMALYLRLLAFSTLFRDRGRQISDRELVRVFSKPGHLAQDLATWFGIPSRSILEARQGTTDRCPGGIPDIEVKALTPPHYPPGPRHPLAEESSTIASIVADKSLSEHLRGTASEMWRMARNETSGLRSHLEASWDREKFGEPPTEEPDTLMLSALAHPPLNEEATSNESLRHENAILHLWLAVSLFSDQGEAPRLSISGQESRVPSRFRRSLRRLPKVIDNATHLFNLAVQFSDGESSYLLTGDADIQLWPAILAGCSSAQTGIQAPHHGSEENVLFSAFSAVTAEACVVSADHFKQWRHPSTRLGVALANARVPAPLYCTNVHPNCELIGGPPPCPDAVQQGVRAVSVTPGKVEWIVNGQRLPAQRCPKVG